jgi:formylmethanofuran dehydrogenase subunit E
MTLYGIMLYSIRLRKETYIVLGVPAVFRRRFIYTISLFEVQSVHMKTFEEVVAFHGHACPGLALGYRVALYALRKLAGRASDEELVAIVENNSCAVDAVQVMTGCTFGKGNLIFRDYGKQAYTFISRPSGVGIRIAIDWQSPEETGQEKKMWDRYMKGDHSATVLKAVHTRKMKKIRVILNAKDSELLTIKRGKMVTPEEARIYPSIRCAVCGEKVMEPRVRVAAGKMVCIPCFEKAE